MRITIIYDNRVCKEGLKADWGFSCLIQDEGVNLLFDTGASGAILLDNMRKLEISPEKVDEIFISHSHFDHTGGLRDFLEINPCKVYLPRSCSQPDGAGEVVRIDAPVRLHGCLYSTGELEKIEQSLIVKLDGGLAVIAGCSHPGVGRILAQARELGRVSALIGGLHGFREFFLLRDIDVVCPTHCTQAVREIMSLFPEKYEEGGAGRVLML